MTRRNLFSAALAVLAATATVAPPAAEAASLRGSPASMREQNQVAHLHGLAFHATAADIRSAVARGELARLEGNQNYQVADFVSFPYLHPAAKLFVERLAAQYRAACGERLVVTSATRPSDSQPSNSHALSVHPAGIAVDLRVSERAECRQWLEAALLGLERRGVINGIREFHPPHYHVAVYPEQYMAYATPRVEQDRREALASQLYRGQLPVAPSASGRSETAGGDGREMGTGADAGAAPGSVTPDPERERRALAGALSLLFCAPIAIGYFVRQRSRKGTGSRSFLG